MNALTIGDVLSSLTEIDEDRIVIKTLQDDVERRLTNFKHVFGNTELVNAMVTVLNYYMPHQDFLTWYEKIVPLFDGD